MNGTLIRGLWGSAIIACLGIVLALVIQGYKVIVPGQVEHNTTNITRAEYDQARARWLAQKIAVYDFSVVQTRGHKLQARLRIDKSTGNLYLMQLTVDGLEQSVDGLATPLTGVTAQVYSVFTVESLFDTVGSAMQNVESGAPPASTGGSTIFTDLDVRFDPVRGYPVSFTQYVRKTLSSNEVTWRSKQESIEISDFTQVR